MKDQISPCVCATSLENIYRILPVPPVESEAQSARLGSEEDQLEVALGKVTISAKSTCCKKFQA